MAEFVRFCDAFSIPVVTFTNVTGFDTTIAQEKNLSKSLARLATAFGEASVPKINVVVENAFGSAYTIMNSKGLGCDVVYAWPNTKIGMMDADAAVKIIYANEIAKADDSVKEINDKAKEYAELQLSANSAASRGYVDSIIEPEDTRKYIIGALEMLYTKREYVLDKKHGTV